MYRPTTTLPVAVAFALWSGVANADQFTDDLVETYQNLGFDYIEIKDGTTQVKVEAIKGTQKYEVIYDRSTGKILKQEIEGADADEIGLSGVEFEVEDEDFLDKDDLDDEDDDEDDDDEDDEDDDEDDDDEDDDEDDDDDDEDDEDDEDDDDEDDDDEDDDEDDD